jgi:hypothetical protein
MDFDQELKGHLTLGSTLVQVANRETVLQTWDKPRLSSDFDIDVKSEECADESLAMCDKTAKKFQNLARFKRGVSTC